MENNIKQILAKKGIKQKFVCDRLGINESVLSLIINNKRKPSQSRLKAMAKLLGVSIKQMYPHCVVKRQNVYYI